MFLRRVTALLVVAGAAGLAPIKGPSTKVSPTKSQVKLGWAKAAAKTVAATALSAFVMFPGAAEAARSGGRAGGGGFRSAPSSRAMPSRSAPQPAPRAYAVPVPVPVPVYGGGYGYGGGMFGISPGTAISLSIVDSILSEQRRSAYLRQQIDTQRQLGRSSAEIDQLQAQLIAQESRINMMQAQQAAAPK
mmetsp:Transcript_13633/g.48406  ORF Transcript_13633/g.48406 Transcript_13633/m.48406 type:complete len:190 (-) Transcript_13633:113-682(-)